MNELHADLVYVRNLLLAMQKLNEDEIDLQAQVRQTSKLQETVDVPKKKNKIWTIIVIAVFLIVSAYTSYDKANILYQGEVRQYEYDAFNEQWYWEGTHPEDEPYPGYDGEEPQFSDYIGMGLIIGVPTGAITALLLGGGFVIKHKLDEAAAKKRNRGIQESNQKKQEQNQAIQLRNNELAAEIQHIHNRKLMISQEYMRNIILWYPKDYGYLRAIDFFINQVENHLASNIKELVEQYQTYEFRQSVMGGIRVIINNQQIMISKQDELIRQQMIGNMINMANLATNISTNAKMSQMASDVRSAANSAASAAGSAADAARTAGQIYRRL